LRRPSAIANDEYERLFDLAIKDHNQAVALNPGNSEVYFNRAQAYYDRGFWDGVEEKGGEIWFGSQVFTDGRTLPKEFDLPAYL
jgi:tetratricopeptide (TPR) repeat protein